MELAEEIKQQWGQINVDIVPAAISSTAVIPACLQLQLAKLDIEPYTIIDLRKAAILNTCATVRKFMNYKYVQWPMKAPVVLNVTIIRISEAIAHNTANIQKKNTFRGMTGSVIMFIELSIKTTAYRIPTSGTSTSRSL